VFKIGARAAMYYDGLLRDLAAWSKVLTPAEVAWLYNSGQPKDHYDEGYPGNLDGWWRLGDGDKFEEFYDSGQYAYHYYVVDQSFNNYLGSTVNVEVEDVVYDAPGHGKSVMFDGVNEYATAGNVLGYERTDPFSLSVWFKSIGSYFLLGKQANSGASAGYGVWLNSTELQFNLVNTQGSNYISVKASNQYNDGRWHHTVFCYDGSSVAANIRCYIDGSLVSLTTVADTLSASIATSSHFQLAGRDTGANYAGRLCHAAVHSKFLSQAEAEWIYNDGVPPDLTGVGAPSNLAAWWKCGEGDTIPTLQDSGPSGYDATTQNMESYDIVADSPADTYHFAQKSYLFDGVNEYVNMGNVLGFEYTNRFSLSCWCKVTGDGALIAKQESSVAVRGYSLVAYPSTNTLWVYLRNNVGTNQIVVRSESAGINDGGWHHVAMTWDGNATPGAAGVKIYVDGVSKTTTIDSDTLSATILNSINFMVGSRSGGDLFLAGKVCEVAVYNRDLSTAEVSWIYNSGKPRDLKNSLGAPVNLVGWWRLGAGGYRSSSANGTWQTRILGDRPGLVSDFATRCLAFDGYYEYVDMGNVLAYERTQPFSISCWARWISDDYGALVAKESASYVGYCLYKYPGGGVVVELQGSVGYINAYSSKSGYGNGQWHHIVATYDGSSTKAGLKLYIDNEDVTGGGTDTLASSIVTTTSLKIGARYPDLFLTGEIDEVAIYGKKLEVPEVSWVYNSGVPRDLKDTNAPSNLAGWWRLGEGAYPGTAYNMDTNDFLYPGAEHYVPPTFRVSKFVDAGRLIKTYSYYRQPTLNDDVEDSLGGAHVRDATRYKKSYSYVRQLPVKYRVFKR
jgi:hypothetical protein